MGGCSDEEIIVACHLHDPTILTLDQAQAWLTILILALLNCDRYVEAAYLIWGPRLFDSRPRAVQRLWSALQKNAQLIILGAAAQGKTFGVCAFLLLDFYRDPEFTGIRIISAGYKHALEIAFSNMQRLHREALVPMPGEAGAGYIGLDRKDRHSGISIISIPKGDSGQQSLQGLHPVPRKLPHPEFGNVSRIRVFLDEAEHIPPAVWSPGVVNILASVDGVNAVKVIAACNPWEPNSIVASLASPETGWAIDIDKDVEWKSKDGWPVVRLDAATSENVTGEAHYEGMLSRTAYEAYYAKTQGRDRDWFCFARGIYSLLPGADELIGANLLGNSAMGKIIFSPGTDHNCGSCDLAFEGDLCVLAIGKYGLATGWLPGSSGQVVRFDEPRWMLQVEQLFTLPKLLTEGQYNQIKSKVVALGVAFD
jgi:hypothetical protein